MRALVVMTLLAVGPGAARAGDGEKALSVAAGVGRYATPGEKADEVLSPYGGLLGGVTFERSFGDYAAVRAQVSGGVYLGGGLAGTGLATVGLSYRLDVLKFVPYVAVGVGALFRGGGPFDTGFEPALEIGGGADWLRSRDRSYGLYAAVTGFASDTTTYGITLRSTWRWGYF